MTSPSPLALLLLALAAIALLVALVTWRKLNAFVALLIAALVVGLGAGMAPLAALKAFQDGLGATLGGIAAVIAADAARPGSWHGRRGGGARPASAGCRLC